MLASEHHSHQAPSGPSQVESLATGTLHASFTDLTSTQVSESLAGNACRNKTQADGAALPGYSVKAGADYRTRCGDACGGWEKSLHWQDGLRHWQLWPTSTGQKRLLSDDLPLRHRRRDRQRCACRCLARNCHCRQSVDLGLQLASLVIAVNSRLARAELPR